MHHIHFVTRIALVYLAASCLAPHSASSEDAPTHVYRDQTNLLVWRQADGSLEPITTADAWPHRRQHILLAMQEAMGPLPDAARRVPLDMQVQGTEVIGTGPTAYVRQRIDFAVEANDRLPGWLLIPTADVAHPRPAALALHQTIAIGKDEPVGLGGSPNLHYAAELAARGYVVLAVDYPNFGTYQFDPYEHGYASATMKGIWNHMRAVDLLCSLPDVDAQRIAVIGHSLGGHNSLFLAALDPRLRCAVTSCGFNSFSHYYDGNLTGWSHRGYMPRVAERYQCDPGQMPFDFTEVLAAIAPRGVFINAPLRDSNFAVSGVRKCVAAAQPVYELLKASDNLRAEYPAAEHDFPPEVRERAYQWLDSQLRPLHREQSPVTD